MHLLFPGEDSLLADSFHFSGKESWLLLASDGLFANEERGGGGGLSNEEIAKFVSKQNKLPISQTVESLIEKAQNAGSTDDITVVLLNLTDK